MRIAVALILALTSSVAASDNYFTATELRQTLLSSGSSSDVAMFRGYVAGVRDVLNGKLFCVPDDVLPRQAAANVRKYLNNHADGEEKAAKLAVINALKVSYRCKD